MYQHNINKMWSISTYNVLYTSNTPPCAMCTHSSDIMCMYIRTYAHSIFLSITTEY